jgi:hypothetical protein
MRASEVQGIGILLTIESDCDWKLALVAERFKFLFQASGR